MLTVILVPGPAAKEAADQIIDNLGYSLNYEDVNEKIRYRDMIHRIIYEVLKEHDISE